MKNTKREHPCCAELDSLAADIEKRRCYADNFIQVQVNYGSTKLKLRMKGTPEGIRERADLLDLQIRRSKRDALLTSSAKETRRASRWKPNYKQTPLKLTDQEGV
mgnify:CR=1 FL=1